MTPPASKRRQYLGSVDLQQEASKAKSPGMTAVSTADANKLYRNCPSIQNAVRLQYPSTQPGNEPCAPVLSATNSRPTATATRLPRLTTISPPPK